MKTKTQLRIDCVRLLWNYDFPEEIQLALEEDYVENHHLYDENALQRVKTWLLIEQAISPQCALSIVRDTASPSPILLPSNVFPQNWGEYESYFAA